MKGRQAAYPDAKAGSRLRKGRKRLQISKKPYYGLMLIETYDLHEGWLGEIKDGQFLVRSNKQNPIEAAGK